MGSKIFQGWQVAPGGSLSPVVLRKPEPAYLKVKRLLMTCPRQAVQPISSFFIIDSQTGAGH